MGFFYIVAIVGIVIFLGTSVMAFRTAREKINNGFAFENENDLKRHTILFSVGSFIFLALCAGVLALFLYGDHHWIVVLYVMIVFLPPAVILIACMGVPLQTLGVIYSVAYMRRTERKLMPSVYIILASISWIVLACCFGGAIYNCVEILFAFPQ